MRSLTLRWIILLFSVVIGVLVAAQLYWLNKIYAFEEKEFSTSVIKSIQGVYEDLDLTNATSAQLHNLVEEADPNTFIFRVDSIPQEDSLKNDLVENLEAFGVFADCIAFLYLPHSSNGEVLYSVHLPIDISGSESGHNNHYPVFKRTYAYIALYFPSRSRYIINSMSWWIISGIFLLLLLIALAVSIFFLYKQKFQNEIQNDFIRNVTHEFQTPITTLTIGLDAISKSNETDDKPKITRYTHLMQGQIAYLRQHVENLIKVLKADANGFVLNREPVVPNDLVKEAIRQLYAAIEEKNAKVQLNLEGSDAEIMADRNSLFVVILNLISNAIKFSKEPIVTIETITFEGKYRISVKDNGIGIDPFYHKRLFRKFYRVPTGDVHDVKGLGLGLYLVRKIVESHKGSVSVNSNAGAGTEFTINLPIK